MVVAWNVDSIPVVYRANLTRATARVPARRGARMKRPVAISLIAAICLGSPAMARSSPAEQMVNGKGARDRSGGSSGGSGTATRNDGGSGRTSAERRGDDGDGARQAVQRAPDRDRSNAPVAVRPPRPTVITVNNNYGYAPSYRPRYYAPAYYHRWAGSYYGWSPVSYVPWPWIYGSIGWSNFGFYTAFGTTYPYAPYAGYAAYAPRSEEHTSELQSQFHLVCRLLLEKKKTT